MMLMDVTPRETALESGGYVKGAAIALVTQNQDPDGLGRVRVSYPWHDQPRESHWARVAMPMAGKERGLVLIPEVGDEVLVVFEREDMRFPCVVGSLYNGKEPPHVNNSDGRNDIRSFKSRKGHRLTFNDNEARGSIEFALDDGKSIQIDDDGLRLDDGQGNTISIDSRGGTISLEAASKLQLKAPLVAIESSGPAEMKASATLTLRGTLVNIN